MSNQQSYNAKSGTNLKTGTSKSNTGLKELPRSSTDNVSGDQNVNKNQFTLDEIILIQLMIINVIVFFVLLVFFIQYYRIVPVCPILW